MPKTGPRLQSPRRALSHGRCQGTNDRYSHGRNMANILYLNFILVEFEMKARNPTGCNPKTSWISKIEVEGNVWYGGVSL